MRMRESPIFCLTPRQDFACNKEETSDGLSAARRAGESTDASSHVRRGHRHVRPRRGRFGQGSVEARRKRRLRETANQLAEILRRTDQLAADGLTSTSGSAAIDQVVATELLVISKRYDRMPAYFFFDDSASLKEMGTGAREIPASSHSHRSSNVSSAARSRPSIHEPLASKSA